MNKTWPNEDGAVFMSEGMSYEKLEEDLTCLVCLELYADPLMMPCSHSVCKACLHNIMRSREKAGKHDLECPACRETHNLTREEVQVLPKNLALENIVFRYQELQSFSLSRPAHHATSPQPHLQASSHSSPKSTPLSYLKDSSRDQDSVFDDSVEEKSMCGMCVEEDRKEASWFCPQCQVLYCQTCLDTFHPRRGSLVKHKVRKATGSEVTSAAYQQLLCYDHRDEQASIFCDTCKVVGCHLCVCTGQGAHCSHSILDLDTAYRQLQETAQRAQEKLSVLGETFSQRENAISAQLQSLLDLEKCAKNSIISQYSCLLSDVSTTLELAKKRFLDQISSLSAYRSTQLVSQNDQITQLYSQCQDLNETFQKFLYPGENMNDSMCSVQSPNSSFITSPGRNSRTGETESDSSPREKRVLSEGQLKQQTRVSGGHVKGTSSLSGDKSHSRTSNRWQSSAVVDGDVKVGNMSGSVDSCGLNPSDNAEDEDCVKSEGSGPAERRSATSMSRSSTDDADGDNSMTKKTLKKGKSVSELGSLHNSQMKARSSPESNSKVCGEHKEENLRYIAGAQRHSSSEISQASNFYSGQQLETALDSDAPIHAEALDISVAKKLAADLKNSERKHSGSNSSKLDSEKWRPHSELTDSPSPGLTQKFVFESKMDRNRYDQSAQLLLRADQLGPVLDQVATLSREVLIDHTRNEECEQESGADHEQRILSCVSAFQQSSLSLIQQLTALQTSETCPAFTPSVRSVSISSPNYDSCLSRVQSRVLLTWGFNSTTFTADPVTSAAQWTVSINQNTSHIGDVKSGYLFGVGVASKPLTSKDQAGMNHNSHAVVCLDGYLGLCYNNQMSPIMPLPELPLSVTLSVSPCPPGNMFMSYSIRVSGVSGGLHGRRILATSDGGDGVPEQQKESGIAASLKQITETEASHKGGPKSCGKTAAVDCKSQLFSVHPVFTVSQRVKMQFPQASDV